MAAKLTRYQVFISSTFKDLGPERAAVLNMVLSLNHIPAGMELFPASQQTPWEIIQQVIDISDYYVLVVAGMYGSTDTEGISYTEREYDYAHENEKPVIALIHAAPDELPVKSVELDQGKREKLSLFIKKVRSRHHVKTWNTPDDLAGKVAQALAQAINTSPAIGWVRADGVDNTELLKKISTLYEENSRMRSENDQLRSAVAASDDAAVVQMADRLSTAATDWFLSLSSGTNTSCLKDLTRERSGVAKRLLDAKYLYASDVASRITLTHSGWELREELLLRKMLLLCLNSADGLAPTNGLPARLGASVEEAGLIESRLSRSGLIERVSVVDRSIAIRLTSEGRVKAERLDRMKH